MEQKKYTFKYIHLADGLVDSTMSSFRFNFLSLKFCLIGDSDKKKLDDIALQLQDFVKSLADKEIKSVNDWKNENINAKEG